MIYPVCCGAAGLKRVLEVAMETFHHPGGLQMVCCCLSVMDVKQVAHGGPKGGGVLGAMV